MPLMLKVIVCCTSGGSSEMTSTSVQCATTMPAIPPSTASSSDSVRSCPIKRARLAPIESRMAISPARGRSREQQVRDVGAGDEQHERRDAKHRRSGVFASSGTELWPRPPGARRMGFARKRAIVCALMSFCSGASTSLMMA